MCLTFPRARDPQQAQTNTTTPSQNVQLLTPRVQLLGVNVQIRAPFGVTGRRILATL